MTTDPYLGAVSIAWRMARTLVPTVIGPSLFHFGSPYSAGDGGSILSSGYRQWGVEERFQQPSCAIDAGTRAEVNGSTRNAALPDDDGVLRIRAIAEFVATMIV